jgi:hypothetical protein
LLPQTIHNTTKRDIDDRYALNRIILGPYLSLDTVLFKAPFFFFVFLVGEPLLAGLVGLLIELTGLVGLLLSVSTV